MKLNSYGFIRAICGLRVIELHLRTCLRRLDHSSDDTAATTFLDYRQYLIPGDLSCYRL